MTAQRKFSAMKLNYNCLRNDLLPLNSNIIHRTLMFATLLRMDLFDKKHTINKQSEQICGKLRMEFLIFSITYIFFYL